MVLRRVLVDGLVFPECPRWHAERLWFSDVLGGRVLSTGATGGDLQVELVVDGGVGGLGFSPQGELLVVSTLDRLLLRRTARGTVVHADLSHNLHPRANDLHVLADGTAFVGGWGFDLQAGEPPVASHLVHVAHDGVVVVVPDALLFPNGMALQDDRLLVAETFGHRISAFALHDGRIGPRSDWALVPGVMPDGIALADDGTLYVADAGGRRVVAVREGEGVVGELAVGGRQRAFACAIGGFDRDLLFLCCAPTSREPAAVAARGGTVEVVDLSDVCPREGLR